MQIIINICGIITLTLASIAIFLFACSTVIYALRILLEKHDALIRRELKNRIGHHLYSSAYWLSESKDAMLALQMYGKDLMNVSLHNGMPDINAIREQWRELRNKNG